MIELNLSQQSLRGPLLAADLATLTQLRCLYLSHNFLTGGITPGLLGGGGGDAVSCLRELDLSANQLTGQVVVENG